jgi:rubrerythrin
MSYKQVRDVIAQSKTVHKFISKYAQRHQEKSGDSLLKGLYSLMAAHDERIEQWLADYQADERQKLLDTWLQFPQLDTLEESMDDLCSVDEMDEQTILQSLLTVEQQLVELYDQTMREVQAPSVQAFFRQLKELEDHHLRTMANNIAELGEMRTPGAQG